MDRNAKTLWAACVLHLLLSSCSAYQRACSPAALESIEMENKAAIDVLAQSGDCAPYADFTECPEWVQMQSRFDARRAAWSACQ